MNYVDPSEIAQKVITGIYPGVTTVELDNLAGQTQAARPSEPTKTPLSSSLNSFTSSMTVLFALAK